MGKEVKKAYTNGAQLLIDPQKTLDRVMPFMSEMGITRIANVTGLDRIGIPVVMVCRPNSRSVAVSQGKGLTLEAAKASGLMESVESWHAERILNPLKLASYADFSQSHPTIDLKRLPVMANSQFTNQVPILWIEANNIVNDSTLWVPYEIVHTNYSFPSPSGSGCFSQSSNGLASGNHYLEAVSHAICECIERDASSLWHQQSPQVQQLSKLDNNSINDQSCLSLLGLLGQAGIETTLWNTTSDIEIPCFECVLLDQEKNVAHIGHGAGCHPDKNIALLRAITEAAQVRTTYITGSRDDLLGGEYTAEGLSERIEAFKFLIGDVNGTADFAQIESQTFDTFDEDLKWILEKLESKEINQVACIDLSRPEIEIPVVRVVIPGLEGPHDDDLYIPGPRAQKISGETSE